MSSLNLRSWLKLSIALNVGLATTLAFRTIEAEAERTCPAPTPLPLSRKVQDDRSAECHAAKTSSAEAESQKKTYLPLDKGLQRLDVLKQLASRVDNDERALSRLDREFSDIWGDMRARLLDDTAFQEEYLKKLESTEDPQDLDLLLDLLAYCRRTTHGASGSSWSLDESFTRRILELAIGSDLVKRWMLYDVLSRSHEFQKSLDDLISRESDIKLCAFLIDQFRPPEECSRYTAKLSLREGFLAYVGDNSKTRTEGLLIGWRHVMGTSHLLGTLLSVHGTQEFNRNLEEVCESLPDGTNGTSAFLNLVRNANSCLSGRGKPIWHEWVAQESEKRLRQSSETQQRHQIVCLLIDCCSNREAMDAMVGILERQLPREEDPKLANGLKALADAIKGGEIDKRRLSDLWSVTR